MKKLLALLPVLAATPIFAQGPPAESVPVGLIAIPVIAVGAVGYGIYRIAKKK
jgi:hypothetical protein